MQWSSHLRKLSNMALCNWHAVTTLSYRANISFNLQRAVNEKIEHRLFLDTINFWRNFAVRILSCDWIGRKLKACWQHFTTTGEAVWNNFMNKRVTVNSNDCLLRESNGHASVAYNNIGKHLARIRLSTTSSEASRPTLLYSALNALKKLDFAFSKEHRSQKIRPSNDNSQPIG